MTEGSWRAVARPTFAYMSFALWGWQLRWKGCSGGSALLGQRGISPATQQPSFLHCSQEFQLSKNYSKGSTRAYALSCAELQQDCLNNDHEDLRTLRPSRLYYKLTLILKRGKEREIGSPLSVFFPPLFKTLNLCATNNKNQTIILIFP